MQRLMVILSFAGVLALTGCTTAREHHNVRQLDASTYEIEVTQPWEKQEVRVRERSYELAQRICEDQKSGMQPLQIVSRPAKEGGAWTRFTFRCVGFVEGPKQEYKPLTLRTENILGDEEEKK